MQNVLLWTIILFRIIFIHLSICDFGLIGDMGDESRSDKYTLLKKNHYFQG